MWENSWSDWCSCLRSAQSCSDQWSASKRPRSLVNWGFSNKWINPIKQANNPSSHMLNPPLYRCLNTTWRHLLHAMQQFCDKKSIPMLRWGLVQTPRPKNRSTDEQIHDLLVWILQAVTISSWSRIDLDIGVSHYRLVNVQIGDPIDPGDRILDREHWF